MNTWSPGESPGKLLITSNFRYLHCHVTVPKHWNIKYLLFSCRKILRCCVCLVSRNENCQHFYPTTGLFTKHGSTVITVSVCVHSEKNHINRLCSSNAIQTLNPVRPNTENQTNTETVSCFRKELNWSQWCGGETSYMDKACWGRNQAPVTLEKYKMQHECMKKATQNNFVNSS